MTIWRKSFIFRWLESLLSRFIRPECLNHSFYVIQLYKSQRKRTISWSVTWQSAAMNIWIPRRWNFAVSILIAYMCRAKKAISIFKTIWRYGENGKRFHLKSVWEGHMWKVHWWNSGVTLSDIDCWMQWKLLCETLWICYYWWIFYACVLFVVQYITNNCKALIIFVDGIFISSII